MIMVQMSPDHRTCARIFVLVGSWFEFISLDKSVEEAMLSLHQHREGESRERSCQSMYVQQDFTANCNV